MAKLRDTKEYARVKEEDAGRGFLKKREKGKKGRT
jgi:hypothetical protein